MISTPELSLYSNWNGGSNEIFLRSRSYWNDISNQHSFLRDLAKHLNITDSTEWFKVTTKHVKQCGGSGLLAKFHSLSNMLVTLCPEYKTACRESVMTIMCDLKVDKVEDLLKLPLGYLKTRYSFHHLLCTFSGNQNYWRSMTTQSTNVRILVLMMTYILVVATVFSELQMKIPTKARHVSHSGYWKDMRNRQAFFENLAKKLSVHIIYLAAYFPIHSWSTRLVQCDSAASFTTWRWNLTSTL